MSVSPRFTPEEIEAKRKHCIAEFQRYQQEYLDELPEHRLFPGDPNYGLYKCRTNFFNAVSLRILLLKRHGVIEEDEEISEFFGYMHNERNWRAFATSYDIDRVNTVIQRVIDLLEGKKE